MSPFGELRDDPVSAEGIRSFSSPLTQTSPEGGIIGRGGAPVKAVYKPKGDNPVWAEKGRIVGLVRQCPGCTIQALDTDGKEVVLSTTVAAKKTTYELEWLKPGTYVLRVTADGYTPLVVDGLVVKAKNDLQMNIEFED